MAAPSVGCPWSAAVAGRPAVRAPLGSSGSSGTWRRRSCWRPAARAPQVSSGSSGTWRRRSWLAACGSCAAGIVGLLRHVAPPIVLAACGSRAAGFVGLLRHVAPPIVLAACGSRAAGFVGLLRHVAPPIVLAACGSRAAGFVGLLRHVAPPIVLAACGSRAAGFVGLLRHVAPPIVLAACGSRAAGFVGLLRHVAPPIVLAACGSRAAGFVGLLRHVAPPSPVGLRFARRWNRRRPPARRAADRPAVRAPLESSASSGTSRRRSACGSRAAGIAGVLRHVAPPIGLRARARQLPPRSRSSAHSRSQRVGASFRRRFWDRSGSSGSPAMKSAHENSDRCGPPPSSSPTATRWPRPPSSAGRRDFCGCGRYERPAGGARLLFGYRVRRTGASGAARTAERRAEHRARSDVRPPAHAERTRAGRPSLRWRFGVLRQGHEWQHAKRSRSRGRGCAQAGLGSGCAGRDVQCAHPRDRLADRAAYTSLGRSLAKAPRGTRRDARGQWCRRTACRCARCSEWRGGHR